MDALNVRRPNVYARATAEIPAMIEIISTLLARGYAYQSGGSVYYPGSYRDLPHIYDQILADFAGQYVLGFASSNHTADGKFRHLKVALKRSGLKALHREGYFAPHPPVAAAK